ncbi:MAG: hypothetical protein QXI99_07855, partial [Candidatus Caldarchaeum sp.]
KLRVNRLEGVKKDPPDCIAGEELDLQRPQADHPQAITYNHPPHSKGCKEVKNFFKNKFTKNFNPP